MKKKQTNKKGFTVNLSVDPFPTFGLVRSD
jgi:hypothetical protein